ncbi:MAG TPA: MFS transporter, partial [Armatimonadaceae bacterium]|nr:MFS transporter [Armatimonadaceae bacterium]
AQTGRGAAETAGGRNGEGTGAGDELPTWGRFRLPRTFAALRHRNFRLFYAGQFSSLIGTWMQDTARQWLVVLLAAPGATLAQAATSGSAAAQQANLYLGMVATASSLPMLFGALYGGVIADRYSKRNIILLAQAAQMVLAFAFAYLTLAGHITVGQVLFLALLFGITTVFDVPARQSFLIEMVGKSDLPNAIALQSSIFNGARVVGPALTGILLGLLSGTDGVRALGWCFAANGVSYLAVIAGLLMMRGDFSPHPDSGGTSPLAALREVGDFLRRHRPALSLICLVTAFSLFLAPDFVLLPSLARFTLGADVAGYGMLLSFRGAGALLGALTMATLSDYPRKGRILMGAGLSFPVLEVVMAFNRSLPVAYVVSALLGFAVIMFLATANSLLQTSTPDDLRGRVMSIYSLILMGLTPVGSLWAGAVANVAGAPAAIAAGGILMGVVAVFMAIRYPALRRAGRSLPER